MCRNGLPTVLEDNLVEDLTPWIEFSAYSLKPHSCGEGICHLPKDYHSLTKELAQPQLDRKHWVITASSWVHQIQWLQIVQVKATVVFIHGSQGD